MKLMCQNISLKNKACTKMCQSYKNKWYILSHWNTKDL